MFDLAFYVSTLCQPMRNYDTEQLQEENRKINSEKVSGQSSSIQLVHPLYTSMNFLCYETILNLLLNTANTKLECLSAYIITNGELDKQRSLKQRTGIVNFREISLTALRGGNIC